MEATSNTELVLDEDAQKLFDALGGIDTSDREDGGAAESFSPDPLCEEQELMDLWRIVLVDFVYVLAQFLSKIKLHGAASVKPQDLAPVIEMLTRIHEMGEQGGRVLIRYRGMKMPDEKPDFERVDYVVSCEGVLVDIPIVKALANRRGIAMSHLPGKLRAAFDRFPSLDIHSLCFTPGTWQQGDREVMGTTLQAAGQFFGACRTRLPLKTPEKGENNSFSVVTNEKGEPDANLTLLAAANRLTAGKVQTLVQKLNRFMTEPKGRHALEQYVSVYDALFAFKNLREKLRRPPIEINSLRRLVVSNDDEAFTPEKGEVVRLIARRLGNSPRELARTIDSVYGDDFSSVSPENLNARLIRVSRLLDSSNKNPMSQRAEKEVLGSLEARLKQVRDDVFETVSLPGQDAGKADSAARPLSLKLQGLVAYFKRRVLTKKKIKAMVHRPMDFNARDYETIARDFGISVEEAERFLGLFKECFDGQGNFIRNAFEKNISYMAPYGVRVFRFLWHYLKEILQRKDRVAFLNSLQILILEMHQSPAALKLLLEDFCRKPSQVMFSDRNAIILANVLLRKYNKEIHNDIEITPEEVLLVQEGLSQEAVKAAGEAVENQRDAFFQKIRTIYGELLEGFRGEGDMPLRFLLSLERECYIFLSLIGGPLGHTIVKSAVKTYGNPGSELYVDKREKGFEKVCLRHLRVAVRGLSRYEDPGDLALLSQVRDLKQDFLAIQKDRGYRDSVQKAMQWVDSAVITLSRLDALGLMPASV